MPIIIDYIHDDDGMGEDNPCPEQCEDGIWCDHQIDPREYDDYDNRYDY
jgi:hypothetical protein